MTVICVLSLWNQWKQSTLVIVEFRVARSTNCTSKGTFLRVNNNNEKFSSDILYFLGKNLKKVQDSCWYFRICANIQVSELQRHIFLGTLFRTPFHDFLFCLIRIRNHLDVSQTMMTSRMTRWLRTPVFCPPSHEPCSTFVWHKLLEVWTMFFHVLS
jgi:hypothetical protein